MVQEAHLRLFDYKMREKVRDGDSLLRRIVLNLGINYYNRHPDVTFERLRDYADPHAGPEQALVAERELGEVVGFLKKKSERVCKIFIAQRSGYSYEEVGLAFGIKSRTVERHVWTAFEWLRDFKIS